MMKNPLLPPNKRLLATMHDPMPNEQLALRNNLIEKQEKEIAALKALVESAWPDLVTGTNAQLDDWLDRRDALLGKRNGHATP